MWAFTSFGILMPAIRPPHTVEEGDDKTMQIRTRRKIDLEILRDEYMGDQLGEIIHTPKFDYNYRAYCRPEDFAAVMAKIVMEIDYEKYKPTILTKYKDHDLHGVTNSVWGTMCRLGTPWEGLKSTGSYKGAWTGSSYSWGGSRSSSSDSASSYEFSDGKWVKLIVNGTEKWVWQSNEPRVDEFDIDYVPDAQEILEDFGPEDDNDLEDLVREYPSLETELRALAADLDTETIKGLHGALVDQAKRDAIEDMRAADLDWHYEEDEDWTPEATNDKGNHRPKKGKKAAVRQQYPEFSG